MSHAIRIVLMLACVGCLGCQTTQEREDELRDLKTNSDDYRRAAADMASRGDQNPERRESFERTALELEERQSRLNEEIKEHDEYEKEHPWASRIGDMFADMFSQLFWQLIIPGSGDDDDDDWDVTSGDYE